MSGYKAVITGASKGIGADLAMRLLDRDYKVIGIDREKATLSHKNLQLIEADLLDPAAVAQVADTLAADIGITHLIHNAGLIWPNLLEDAATEDIAGLAQLHLGSALQLIQAALPQVPALPEWQEEEWLKKQNWPDWHNAAQAVHRPENMAALEPTHLARARLAYDELLAHQLVLALVRRDRKKQQGRAYQAAEELQARLRGLLPFPLTGSQESAIADIAADMAAPMRMLRLLQGDVGSGKTIIAVLASAISVSNNMQVAVMAPTEILAKQHFKSFRSLADHAKMTCALLTGGMAARERSKILNGLENGKIDIIIGTHALFQKDINFKSLGLVIIDEQHRFGVNQRNALLQKGFNPHLLSMTATPIPRTLAITYHGDMDLSIIDELPKNRIPITTKTVNEDRLKKIYTFMNDQVKEGRQCIIVYPLIEETEKSDLAAAADMYNTLKESVFKDISVGLIHGRLEKDLKDKMMYDFSKNKINIIISTTVIEVGIDVPNATVMLIEHAERFGLTQLHQLRGRVGRGSEKSYCILVQRKFSENSKKRLNVMESTNDGFLIADEDLKMRGPGEFFGIKQSGFFNFKLANITTDGDLITIARNAAEFFLDDDLKKLSSKNKIIYDNLMDQYGERLSGLNLNK